MLKSDRYHRNLSSQRNIDLSKKFKIRMPNLITKRMNNYKSWRNFDNSIDRIDKQSKQNLNINSNNCLQADVQSVNPSYQRFMKTFMKQKSKIAQTTIYKGVEKTINNYFNTNSISNIHCEHYETDKDSCQITVGIGESARKLRYKVNSVQNLVSFLKGKKSDVLTYKTIKHDLPIDFALTLENMDISCINGKSIALMPVYRQVVSWIDINSFQILHCIGTGGFSKVFLARFLQDGKFYAMKVINKEFIVKNKKKQIVINQRNIMKQLSNHPFIVKMKFCFESRESLIFVMEYCPGGQLFNLVKRFRKMKQDIAKFYIVQILLGLEKIHQERIIYRDFKPQNILLDLDGHVRIADFGLAKPQINSSKDRAFSFCGSPQYMPPEMIMKSGHSFAVDFYCIGALLYQLVTGLPPFYDKDPNKIYQATVSQTLTFPSHAVLSYQIRQLLYGLLQKNQKYRLGSLSGVRQVLAHPWFGKINRKDYLQRKIIPPVKYSKVQDFNFTFDQIQHENQNYMNEIKKQQKQQNRKYSKCIDNFYFDYRKHLTNEQLIKGEQFTNSKSCKQMRSCNIIQSLCSTRDTKRPYRGTLTNRSRSGNIKLKLDKSPVSSEARIFLNTEKQL